MHTSKCSAKNNHKKIKIHEAKSSTIYIENSNSEEYYLIKYDSCIVQNQEGADYLISKVDLTSVCIIELKGSDVNKAFQQISTTTTNLKNTSFSKSKKSAIIVNTAWPKASTSLQLLMQKYYSNHKGRLYAARHLSSKQFSEIL
ncbi:hypothetical protein [Comamonas aquatica]|uniref:hypothetical protein n=1 Tax=Comamonas aquatica TaxID=225991 RepID=UPI0004B93CED|nr:hypothetical protein [Comamonas aquatica]